MEFLLDLCRRARSRVGASRLLLSRLLQRLQSGRRDEETPAETSRARFFISIVGVAILYFAMQTSILGVIPWQEAARTQSRRQHFRGAAFMAALGHARHGADPRHRFRLDFLRHARLLARPLCGGARRQLSSPFLRACTPPSISRTVSLLALGATAIVFCLSLSLVDVIRAILAMRCLIQFIGQAVGLLMLFTSLEGGALAFPHVGLSRARRHCDRRLDWQSSSRPAAGRCWPRSPQWPRYCCIFGSRASSAPMAVPGGRLKPSSVASP